MKTSHSPDGSGDPQKEDRAGSIWHPILGLGGHRRGRLYKYEHYVFVISMLLILVSLFALLNGYYRYFNISSYPKTGKGSSQFVIAGYLGMALTVAFVPIPDYFLVPIYGYLSSVGLFNPIVAFVACLAGALLLMTVEYVGGRFVGRPLLLKALSHFHISEKDIESADKWLVKHGRFSMFISTFIPYLYSVTSLAAGTLKMRATGFFLACTAGFGIRFLFLEYVGYSSIYVFSPSFDYAQRGVFYLVLVVSSAYLVFYLIRNKSLRASQA